MSFIIKYMRKLSIIASLLSCIILLTLVGACSTDVKIPAASNGPTVGIDKPSPSIASNSTKKNTNQILENDILLKISTSKDTYVPGEVILITASVENQSPNPVKYALSSMGNPTPSVYLENNLYFSGFPLEEKELGGVRTVVPMVTGGQLKPHEIIKREVIWDQMILLRNQQAPQGTYSIGCGLTIGDYQNESSQKRLSVILDIHIVGAPKWITLEQAKNIALNLPEVKTWQETHSGKSVVKQENGNYYVFMMGDWQKVAPQFSASEQKTPLTLNNYKEWMPDVNVTLDKSTWIITMGTKMGPNPHFVRIQINPVTSSVVDAQFSDKDPL
jgi:hypothetical protein